ncbi:MAG: hypothetical protein VYB24_02750 [Pseudomonadota bacterium]|nr:hypothetical protein [Pseudomonadota bacterium]
MSKTSELPPGQSPQRVKDTPVSLIQGSPRVINVGLSGFAEALAAQGVAVIQVDWSPPAHGDADLATLLAKLSD